MRGAIAGILLAAHVAGLAGAAMAAESAPAAACLRAASEAERRWSLPPHLLRAIGEVETGRTDPGTGQRLPWPWSINVEGAGYRFGSAAEAEAAVALFQARGMSSIDVGCFQVNLRHHPFAFRSIAEGFDPAANADYAARFLRSLFARGGGWDSAIAAYHSTDPARGAPYRAAVLAAWRGAGRAPGRAAGDDPHVILIAASAAAIPVYTPRTLPSRLRAALRRAGHF